MALKGNQLQVAEPSQVLDKDLLKKLGSQTDILKQMLAMPNQGLPLVKPE